MKEEPEEYEMKKDEYDSVMNNQWMEKNNNNL